MDVERGSERRKRLETSRIFQNSGVYLLHKKNN